jgi:hypothetical protein
MTRALVALLLLSLSLAGCIVEPGGDHGDRGWGDRTHYDFHGEQGQRGDWGH